jgi:phage terminase large subunit-like protein
LPLSDLSNDLTDLHKQLESAGLAATFPWHAKQEYALRAATDTVVLLGGNRSGKSQGGLGIVSRLIRREGPIYQRLRKPKGRELKIWVAPLTGEKYRSVWEPRLRQQAFAGMEFHHRKAPEDVFTWKDKFGGGTLWGKSAEQGPMSFESDDVDLVIFDEEPDDPQVCSSAATRLATTNGIIVYCYTPLNGMSWTWDQMIKPTCKDEYKISDRVWRRGNEITVVQMGMADNPEAVAGGGVARMMADQSMSPAEKDARLYGEYGFTEGLLFPGFATLKADDEANPYLIDKLPDDRIYSWLFTADPNKRHGGLLTAFDHEGNRFVCGEHYMESLPDSEHARHYGVLLKRFGLSKDDIEIWADPGGAGAQAIINLSEVGYFARPVPKDAGSVAASIKLIRRHAWIDPSHRHPVTKKLGAPHIYILRNLRSEWKEAGVEMSESRLMWELRQYRQKPDAAPDTPIKKKDDVVDCLRYAEIVRMAEPEQTFVDPTKAARATLDQGSRQEAEVYDKLLERMAGKVGVAVVKPS